MCDYVKRSSTANADADLVSGLVPVILHKFDSITNALKVCCSSRKYMKFHEITDKSWILHFLVQDLIAVNSAIVRHHWSQLFTPSLYL